MAAVSAISGTSAFVTLFLADRNTLPAKILTGLIATASILNLVFGFGKKADLHDKLAREFTKLAADIEVLPATPSNLAKCKARRLNIEADEPTVRRIIDLRAQNDEWRSRGVRHDRLCPLGYFQRRSWLAYFFDFGLGDLEARLKERDAPKSLTPDR